MNKTGIITFHRALNYGAVLQAVSLCGYLRAVGRDAEIIDYDCVPVRKKYEYTPFCQVGSMKAYVARTGQVLLHSGNRKNFDDFLTRNAILSPVCTRDTIGALSSRYTTVIVGSDQVWNPSNTDRDSTFLLDFLPDAVRRIAYAASLGAKENFSEFGNMRDGCLKKFSAISCREEDGCDLLRSLGFTAEAVVDPVFLTDSNKWEKIAAQSGITERKPYIFLYSVRASAEMFAYAKWLSEKTGFPVIATDIMLKGDILAAKSGFLIRSAIGPADFLKYISHAEYVVTDSFHGTSLSMIFHKRFMTAPDKRTTGNTGSRLDNILTMCSLQGRYIDSIKSRSFDEEIDYETAEIRLQTLVLSSKEFIERALTV